MSFSSMGLSMGPVWPFHGCEDFSGSGHGGDEVEVGVFFLRLGRGR